MILFVCTGNICRSAMAEGIARRLMEGAYPGCSGLVEVSSAGTAAVAGNPPTLEAIEAMGLRGIDIRRHRARSVTRDIVRESNLVLVMESRQRAPVSLLAGGRHIPVFLLLELGKVAREVLDAGFPGTPGGPYGRLLRLVAACEEMERSDPWILSGRGCEVADPLGMPLEDYVRAADIMEGPIEKILKVLLAGLEPGDCNIE